MSSTTRDDTSKIRFTCFVCGETIKDIFHVTIDKKLTVNNLEAEIKTVRQDLQEKKTLIYIGKVSFKKILL
ncbi:hypothetical protein RhiirA5_353658 [Rhizophagus irregularis]|uniref:Crinkler effector protein N-terminal domain-containing protein n=1 Tax=Rhizophagus irregularis TaxID=588596 RepID=A0A2N0PYI3_9GLOM|nr:hypothetical protein RhiirA5_353658 [Rhizophagus irregularis]